MLKSITTFVCLLPLLCFGQGIDFQDLSFDEALVQAKAENKLVFIDGFATWCGPCKRMDVTTFKDDNVGMKINPSFVSLKLDMEKDEGLKIAKEYNVKAYPTYIFLNGEGEVLHKGAGYFESEDFLELVAMSRDTVQSLGALQARFDEGDRDTVLLNALLEQQFLLLDPHYMTVARAKLELEENWDTDENRSFLFKYTNSAASPLFEYLVTHKNDFYNQFGEGATFGKIEKLVRDRSFEIESTTIEEMKEIFKLVYPKQAKEMGSKYRLSYYRQKGDRKNYAVSAIEHYKLFPSRDPQELNEVGATFSRVIDDQILLKKVLPLMEKSIKIDDAYYNNDTLAALLFKLGDIEGAKKTAVKAINLAKLEGEDSSYTEELLEAITSHLSN